MEDLVTFEETREVYRAQRSGILFLSTLEQATEIERYMPWW